jgi:hypothetical protein
MSFAMNAARAFRASVVCAAATVCAAAQCVPFADVRPLHLHPPATSTVPSAGATVELPTDVGAADFDRNGFVDGAVACALTQTIVVTYGAAAPSFNVPAVFGALPQQVLPLPTGVIATAQPFALATMNFNPDSFADLVVLMVDLTGAPRAFVHTFAGSASGLVSPGTSYPVFPFSSFATTAQLGVGDFNGDGLSDLIVATTGSVDILPGTGAAFGPSFTVYTPLPGEAVVGVAVGDVDGDLVSDFAVLSTLAGGATQLQPFNAPVPGPGVPTFLPQAAVISVAAPAAYVLAADVNCDGLSDFVVLSPTIGEVFFETGIAAVSISTSLFSALSPWNGRDADAADIDFDGDVDLLLSGTNGDVIAYANTNTNFGPFPLNAPSVLVPGGGATFVDFAGLDGDPVRDVVAAVAGTGATPPTLLAFRNGTDESAWSAVLSVACELQTVTGPRLRFGAPTFTWSYANLPTAAPLGLSTANGLWWVFVDVGSSPTPVGSFPQAGGSCALWLDPLSPTAAIYGPASVDASGNGAQSIVGNVPPLPSLVGVQVTSQGLGLTAGTPGTYLVTNGVTHAIGF